MLGMFICEILYILENFVIESFRNSCYTSKLLIIGDSRSISWLATCKICLRNMTDFITTFPIHYAGSFQSASLQLAIFEIH